MLSIFSHSDSNCTRGFPDIPVSKVGSLTRNSGMTTLLIPEMNFTYNVSIVGFIVAGTRLNSMPHSQIQIWRKNSLQTSVYYKVGGVSVNTANSNNQGERVCVAMQIIGTTYWWCILYDQLSIQSGDILGLELPDNNDEIFFTKGGPENYVFQRRLDSNVTLSNDNDNSYTYVRQLPQISLNFTSGKITAVFHCDPPPLSFTLHSLS